MIRRAMVAAARSRLAGQAVRLLEGITSPDPDRLAILTYHRIDTDERRPDLYPGLISASPDEFEQQASHIAAHHRPLSLDTLIEVKRGTRPLPPRSVLLTFDDAYRDVVLHAAPILERHGVPSVLFVPTAYPDEQTRGFWWDRLYAAVHGSTFPLELVVDGGRVRVESADHVLRAVRHIADAVKRLPHDAAMRLVEDLLAQMPARSVQGAVASWAELAALAGTGMALAPHSHTHPRLDRLAPRALCDELQRPRAAFRAHLGFDPPPVLAYPDGAHDDIVVAATRRAGFELAFTTIRGTNSLRDIDWLRIRRINVGQRSNIPMIRAQLLRTRRLGAGTNGA